MSTKRNGTPLREVVVERRFMYPEDRVRKIMEGFPHHWRWFLAGDWIVLEGPLVEMTHHLEQHSDVHSIEPVFRSTPAVGTYLRFLLRPLQETLPQEKRLRKRAVATR